MARKFRYTLFRRFVDRIMRGLLRAGVGPNSYFLLTVPGRKTGRLYSTPVALVIEGDQRWLVAPYGPVNWVLNARAAGQVTLSKGKRSEVVKLVELGPEESAPVLKKYITLYSVTRPYFDVKPDSPLEAFVKVASGHPVFAVQE
jgi:deazaflavin-dependent oxidoreductase (nitroreductase family)